MTFNLNVGPQFQPQGGLAEGFRSWCRQLLGFGLVSVAALGVAVPAHSASEGVPPASQAGGVAASPNPPAALIESRGVPEPVGADQGATPAEPVALSYSVREGEPLDRQLLAWAQREGWSLRWQVPVSWEAFSSVDVKAADVRQAIESVVQTLRQDGAPIRMHVFSNRVIVIESSAISQSGVAP